MSTPLSGGYCGGVPPLPIPNREVKPTCADGTAMQCGRVGSRLFSNQSVHLSNQVNAFLVVHIVRSWISLQPYRPCTDGTPCSIGQCGRVGSCLFSYQRPWREISEVFFVLSGLSCCPCTDGTPCQIGQCGRVGSRLFSYEAFIWAIKWTLFCCIPFTHSYLILPHPLLLWG